MLTNHIHSAARGVPRESSASSDEVGNQTGNSSVPDQSTEAPSAKFHSILFDGIEVPNEDEAFGTPDFFRDLNLDQIVEAVTAGRDEYNLKPLFHMRLGDISQIEYRHAIMKDLENEALFRGITSFSARMRSMREHVKSAEDLYYKYQQEGLFLDAIEIYCETVQALLHDLCWCDPGSRGLLAFREYLAQYAASSPFKTLLQETKKLKFDLAAIRYTVQIKGDRVTVRNYDSEIDYSVAVEETFSRFKRGAPKDYRVKFRDTGMNHIEARILELVGQLNPAVFQALDEYCTRNRSYLDKTIARFVREVQFYVSWLEYAAVFKQAGLKFCYPQVSDTCKEISSSDSFDLALAGKLLSENTPVVCNDFFLRGEERILVVTGPNQGGKTTFARMFGQLHYFANLGCPVPGTEARLFFFDRIFAHFEREEDISTLQGKLQNDLVRIHRILAEATSNSIIIINEIFSSTTLKDAAYLGTKVVEEISQLDSLCVCVTFLDELSALNGKTVSAVATVVPDNPTLRTHRIERMPAAGLSYAQAIARKYRLTYEQLKERIKQ
jgi:DNA mismatch repair protein MutS